MNTLAAPFASRASAIHSPMPEPPPVITKTMSFTEKRLFISKDDMVASGNSGQIMCDVLGYDGNISMPFGTGQVL
jgi:hypothetical protein